MQRPIRNIKGYDVECNLMFHRSTFGQSGNVLPPSSGQHLLLKSQIGNLKAEKEEVINQLKQAHTTIALLETENADFKSEAERTTGKSEI